MFRAASPLLALVAVSIASVVAEPAHAFSIALQRSAFTTKTNEFSGVTNFSLSIEVLEPLGGGVYANPTLGDIEFIVRGSLDPTTPARTANPLFTGFAVEDIAGLSGQQFYDLGNSLSFEIAVGSDLSDGLQVSELVGDGLVFEFDGHEDDTGRYHPPLLRLFSDGTGWIRNSDNTGGVNPVTGVVVNASIGDEYRTSLTFDPTAFTLVVPEPVTAQLLGVALAWLAFARRRRTL